MAVTITHQHGYLTDCDNKTNWTEDGSPTLTSTSLTVLHGDIFQIQGTASAADQKTYFEYDLTDIDSDEFPAFLVRYKTQEASAGLQAGVELVFTSGTQTILASTFSTSWATSAGTVTATKTVDKVRFYAVSDAACSAKKVYYDFLLLHKGTFTFPHIGPGRIQPNFNRKKAMLEIPGRGGDIEQDLGMNSPEIMLSGTLLEGEDWGTPDFEKLYYIVRDGDPWQWFTCDRPYIRCKASVQGFTPLNTISDNTASLGWELRLKQYSLSSLGESTWDNKQWFGYE